jgi:hypothetical protein
MSSRLNDNLPRISIGTIGGRKGLALPSNDRLSAFPANILAFWTFRRKNAE